MKPLLPRLIALSLTCGAYSSTAVAKDPKTPQLAGKAETEMRCLICHGNAQTGQQRLAPPMAMVKRRYQSLSQKEFENAVFSWVKKPDPKKSRMPGAIRRFNLMPTFPIPEAEIKLITQYIYKTDFTFPGNCGTASGQNKQNGNTPEKGKAPQTEQGCDESNCGPDKSKGTNKSTGSKKPQS